MMEFAFAKPKTAWREPIDELPDVPVVHLCLEQAGCHLLIGHSVSQVVHPNPQHCTHLHQSAHILLQLTCSSLSHVMRAAHSAGAMRPATQMQRRAATAPIACCQRTGATDLRNPVCSQLPRAQGIAASLVCRYTSVKGECSAAAHAQLHVSRTPAACGPRGHYACVLGFVGVVEAAS